jgi:hypothetical protein
MMARSDLPGGGSRSGETGAQAVTGELSRIEAECFDIAFDHDTDTFAGKSLGQNLIVAVHDSKDRPLINSPTLLHVFSAQSGQLASSARIWRPGTHI